MNWTHAKSFIKKLEQKGSSAKKKNYQSRDNLHSQSAYFMVCLFFQVISKSSELELVLVLLRKTYLPKTPLTTYSLVLRFSIQEFKVRGLKPLSMLRNSGGGFRQYCLVSCSVALHSSIFLSILIYAKFINIFVGEYLFLLLIQAFIHSSIQADIASSIKA